MLEFCSEPYCRVVAPSAAAHRVHNPASANCLGMTTPSCERDQQRLWNDNVCNDNEARLPLSGLARGVTPAKSVPYGNVAPQKRICANPFRMTTSANPELQPLWNDNAYKKPGGGGCSSRESHGHQELSRVKEVARAVPNELTRCSNRRRLPSSPLREFTHAF